MAMSAQGMTDKIVLALGTKAGTISDVDRSFLVGVCAGIISEIVTNSELVPVSTDSGSAGAGIITGKVK